ncbi:MAG: DUF58 domain-containing protein [Lachnospiraceae bacterium]|nr:DUF58 domain-containing protein [Lachnospiraceae bacterium]
MRRNRLIFLGLWLASLAGISFRGGPVTYGLFTFLTLLPVLSLFYLFAVFLAFKVYQHLEGRDLVAHHPHPFLFILENETFFPFSCVKVNLFSDYSAISGQDDGAEYELLPHTGIRNEATLLCRYRGEYDVGVESIEIVDFLKLFRVRYRNPSTVKARVQPDLIRLNELKSVDIQLLTSADSPSSDAVPDAVVRDYVPGDDARFIEWKATARSGSLKTRVRTGETQQGIGILMGTERTTQEPAGYLPVENKLIETTLALAWFFAADHTPVTLGLKTSSFKKLTVDRPEKFGSCYEALSSLVFTDLQKETDLLQEAGRDPAFLKCRIVFIVIKDLSAEALSLAAALNRSNVSAVVCKIVTDPEEQLPVLSLPRTQLIAVPAEKPLEEVL